MTVSGHPETNEYGSWYQGYINLVPENDVVAAVEAQTSDTASLLGGISEEAAAFRYAPEKWSIKQIVGHLADAERVFGYRILAIARGETAALPAFDENEYVKNGGFDDRPFAELVAELAAVRKASIAMLRGFAESAWMREGVANNARQTVRAVAYTMVGHERHHMKVLRERYLSAM